MTEPSENTEIFDKTGELRQLEPSICLDRVDFPIQKDAIQFPVKFYSDGVSMVCVSLGTTGKCEITGTPTKKCPQAIPHKYTEENYTEVS